MLRPTLFVNQNSRNGGQSTAVAAATLKPVNRVRRVVARSTRKLSAGLWAASQLAKSRGVAAFSGMLSESQTPCEALDRDPGFTAAGRSGPHANPSGVLGREINRLTVRRKGEVGDGPIERRSHRMHGAIPGPGRESEAAQRIIVFLLAVVVKQMRFPSGLNVAFS